MNPNPERDIEYEAWLDAIASKPTPSERAPLSQPVDPRQPRQFKMSDLAGRTAYDAVIASASERNRRRARSCNHGGGQS